jgi:hypothetical protein
MKYIDTFPLCEHCDMEMTEECDFGSRHIKCNCIVCDECLIA